MSIPGWFELAVLSLGAWRIFHLLGHDDILERPRRYVTRLPRNWRSADEAAGGRADPIPAAYREKLADFIECPFCLGFWTALAVWGAWEMWPRGTMIAMTPWALSALVVGAHKYLSAD